MTEIEIEKASIIDAGHLHVETTSDEFTIAERDVVSVSMQDVVSNPQYFKVVKPESFPAWVAYRHPQMRDVNEYLRSVLGTHEEIYSQNMGFGETSEGVSNITNSGDIPLKNGSILRRTRRWIDKARGDSTVDWWLISDEEFHQIPQAEAEWILFEMIRVERSVK